MSGIALFIKHLIAIKYSSAIYDAEHSGKFQVPLVYELKERRLADPIMSREESAMSSHAHRPQEFPSSGAVATYLHSGGKIGVLSRSAAKPILPSTAAFRQLIHDLAMHIAAASPRFIRREHVSAEILEREKDIFRSQLASIGKPPQVVAKILEGKISKFY
jgi:elongation factor Ts